MDGANFKDALETTLADMGGDAEKSGVSLPNAPSKYDFTFKPQRGSLDFAPETLVPMATQVAEIKAICDVLFDARVHALTGLRRLPVAKQDVEATDYLVGKKPTTNTVTGAVLAPYEIQFQGFTTELAAVVEGFYRSSNCFIVRNIDVQTNVVNVASETARPLPSFMPIPNVPATEVPQMSPGELMRRRYGFGPGGRYGPSAPVAPAPAPTPGVFVSPAHKGPVTVLDERPFKTTMYVEAVRLIERARPKSGK